jgi:hypothetical protein
MSNRYLTRPIHYSNPAILPKYKAACGSGSRILSGDLKDVTCKRCRKQQETREGGANRGPANP